MDSSLVLERNRPKEWEKVIEVTLDNLSKFPLGFHLVVWNFYTLGGNKRDSHVHRLMITLYRLLLLLTQA
jgi:hypothetical protein